MESGDCGENSVRSEIVEDIWDDSRLGEIQPTHRWYSWNGYLPNDFPIQNTVKLLLGQFYNSECPHLSFTRRGGKDNDSLCYETMKLWIGDCKQTNRKKITAPFFRTNVTAPPRKADATKSVYSWPRLERLRRLRLGQLRDERLRRPRHATKGPATKGWGGPATKG